MTIFSKPGLYLNNPRGGVEDVADMAAAGFQWIAINCGDFASHEWDTVKQRASGVLMPVLPWAYCRSQKDLARLGELAKNEFNSRAIFNCEAELRDGVYSIDQVVQAAVGIDAALSTEPIPYANVSWYKAKHMTLHAQIFPGVNEESRDPRFCRQQFYLYGMGRVEFMYGIKAGGVEPPAMAFPGRQGGYSVFTADVVKPDPYTKWQPQTLTPVNIPYTGPFYAASSGKTPTKGATVKALKIAMHRAGFGSFATPDLYYNAALQAAMIRFQEYVGITPTSGNYGLGSYNALRVLFSAIPGGAPALNQEAINLMRGDS